MRNKILTGLVPALVLAALPALASAGVFVGVSVDIAPPPLPVYVQPPCPEAGYIWVPGYWAWNDGAYYWVPGTWLLPPRVGLLWTPGYWGWVDGAYLWHGGYWGPHVGFYGGVPYGYGYDGVGFDGGYWRGGMFFYNRAVVHVGPRFVSNVYYHPVAYRRDREHVSFNGGPGGIAVRPTREQVAFEHERHVGFTPMQQRQQRAAFADRSLRADFNHGRPPIAATARPVMFHGHGAVAARAAGGPVRFAPAHRAAQLRSDRPAWAAGQPRGGRAMGRPMQRPMQRNAPHDAQPRFEAGQRFQSAPRRQVEGRPQNNFQQRGYRPMQPQARPQPRYRQQPPQFRQQFRPQERAPVMRGAPRAQQRGGERPQGPPQERHPPRDHGGRGR
jgi:WXXGXW repeat (2 copies)